MSEYHLFIIWENARHKEDEILNDINSDFEIIYKINVRWSKKSFSNNLTRFYGVNLPEGSSKETHIGTGDFLVVVVRDVEPAYGHHDTSKGKKYINSRTFLAKTKYRDLTDGGHKVHATNTSEEFSHDFALLFGCSIDDFEKKYTKRYPRTINYNHDLIGSNGWRDIRQFFNVLNLSTEYVVLRNWDQLPDDYYADLHGDIDILTDNFENMRLIANAEKVFHENNRVHCKVRIGKEEILFDFRFTGDGYYDELWQNNILSFRKFDKDRGFYIVDKYNHFYSLAYHAIIHKPDLTDDYKSRLVDMDSTFSHESDSNKFIRLLCKKLGVFMVDNNYEISKPESSVFFNNDHVDRINKCISVYREQKNNTFLKDSYGFDSLSSFESLQSGVRHFYKAIKDDQSFFVKTSSVSHEREFNLSKKAFDTDSRFFAEPVEYIEGDVNTFISKWVDGVQLDVFLNNNKISTKQRKSLLNDLLSISDVLWKNKIVHRDLILRNFMVSDSGNLVLIDFYWAVEFNNYEEYDYVKDDIENIRLLGEELSFGLYEWDDAHSFMEIAKIILERDINTHDSMTKKLEARLGKRVIRPSGQVFQKRINEERAHGYDLQEKIDLFVSENADLKRHIEELKLNIQNLSNAKSWKITSPLRYISKAVRSIGKFRFWYHR
ncbi:MAG TPA: RIO1 family regulatory kinase/ATPase [Candidatus Saccharibacteria bacterium]|nr:RIO1 family regulatory kinase/ATPase [Candidatus Saccharibacteria bacterium]HRQ07109.1 RIO1 family regulatory kinase/ATPase [Candidatus Saccharibacteria bacterium]